MSAVGDVLVLLDILALSASTVPRMLQTSAAIGENGERKADCGRCHCGNPVKSRRHQELARRSRENQ